MSKKDLHGLYYQEDIPYPLKTDVSASPTQVKAFSTAPVPNKISGTLAAWALFGLPSAWFAWSGGWGFVTAMFGAILLSFCGGVWARMCPIDNQWVRETPMLVGGAAFINAILGLLLPGGLLLMITVIVLGCALAVKDE